MLKCSLSSKIQGLCFVVVLFAEAMGLNIQIILVIVVHTIFLFFCRHFLTSRKAAAAMQAALTTKNNPPVVPGLATSTQNGNNTGESHSICLQVEFITV